MPDEEPPVLLQMQQNIAIQLGIAQNRSFSQDFNPTSTAKPLTKDESSESNQQPRLDNIFELNKNIII